MASDKQKNILITGATGKQGGSVIRALVASAAVDNYQIFALTRSKASKSAQSLASNPNITLVEGDLDDVTKIFDQLDSVWGVFSVQINNDQEELQGKSLINAAVVAGVQHFVYASGDRGGLEKSDVTATTVKNFAAKYRIEQHLKKTQMTYTILRPVTFYENLTTDTQGKGFARLWEQIGSEKGLQMVSTSDIGWFGAQAFLHSEDPMYHNTAISLAGDEITQQEADAIFKKVFGRSMPMIPCPIASALKMLKRDTVGGMFSWFEEEGYGADIQMCRRLHPEQLDFQAWLEADSEFARSKK